LRQIDANLINICLLVIKMSFGHRFLRAKEGNNRKYYFSSWKGKREVIVVRIVLQMNLDIIYSPTCKKYDTSLLDMKNFSWTLIACRPMHTVVVPIKQGHYPFLAHTNTRKTDSDLYTHDTRPFVFEWLNNSGKRNFVLLHACISGATKHLECALQVYS